MSSHDLSVPDGWTRGRDLKVLASTNNRFALAQGFDPSIDSIGSIKMDHIAYITFDSNEDMQRFIRWWFCPCKCSANFQ